MSATPRLTCLCATVMALSACTDLGMSGIGTEPLSAAAPLVDPSIPAPAEQSLAATNCTAPSPVVVSSLQAEISAARAAEGKSPVTFADNLSFAAQAHACDMAQMGRATVVGSNGSSVVHRVRAVEYAACSSAQLIGRAGNAAAQKADWLRHAPEREILLHQKFDDAGVGVVSAGGRLWWSLVLADDCSANAPADAT